MSFIELETTNLYSNYDYYGSRWSVKYARPLTHLTTREFTWRDAKFNFEQKMPNEAQYVCLFDLGDDNVICTEGSPTYALLFCDNKNGNVYTFPRVQVLRRREDSRMALLTFLSIDTDFLNTIIKTQFTVPKSKDSYHDMYLHMHLLDRSLNTMHRRSDEKSRVIELWSNLLASTKWTRPNDEYHRFQKPIHKKAVVVIRSIQGDLTCIEEYKEIIRYLRYGISNDLTQRIKDSQTESLIQSLYDKLPKLAPFYSPSSLTTRILKSQQQ